MIILFLNLLTKREMKKKLLLHSCCGPCSTIVVENLIVDYEVTIFFYNPNIEPYDEYQKRKEEQIKLLDEQHPTVKFIDGDYNNDSFHSAIKEYENEREGSKRCYYCLNLRMEETIKYAKNNSFDLFDTTLSVSPHKNSQWILEIGKILSTKYNLDYLAGNYKKNNGYQESVLLAKKYSLYRQDYCGCLMSKEK